MTQTLKALDIGFWNINKLKSKHTDKCLDNEFTGSIKRCDIIGLAEVKCDINECTSFNDFVVHFINRNSANRKQFYGGLGILIKRNIRKGVKYLPNTCSEYQWLILDKTFFGLDRDFYICFTYIHLHNTFLITLTKT